MNYVEFLKSKVKGFENWLNSGERGEIIYEVISGLAPYLAIALMIFIFWLESYLKHGK